MRNMLESPITTADQLLLHHEPGQRLELVRGELRRMSNAGWWHGAVASATGERLQTHVRTHRLGLAFAAGTGFLLARNPDTVRSPDAAFVRADRVPATMTRGYFPGAPDLAVEVRSPGDRAQLDAKIADWFAHGSQLVWIVDTEARTVTSLRPGRPARTFAVGELVPGEDVVPGLSLPVAELFPPLG
jgi:Uma2 family endonuclease